MQNLGAIILAAGKGKRMKSSIPKVLFPVAGMPMVLYPIRIAQKLRARKIVAVVGYKEKAVRDALKKVHNLHFSLQKGQNGTGHAVLSAEKEFKNFSGSILILSGDVPLLTTETVRGLLRAHRRNRATVSIISAMLTNPSGYGRVLRDESGRVWKIIEETDATASERTIQEVNAGVYLAEAEFLFNALRHVSRNNKQNEYYLPQIINYAYTSGRKVLAYNIRTPEEISGVNNRSELASVNRAVQMKLMEALSLNGVSFIDPDSTYIDYGVRIMPDAVIYPNTFLLGNTRIGKNCLIEQGVTIKDSVLESNVHIKAYSVISESVIKSHAVIGPFAHLRPGNIVGEGSVVGNFVELKKTSIGKETKAAHLTYLGDAVVGAHVNVGCGTITCNYDGFKKHKTVIGDGAFIGSDTQFVAPVKIGRNAYIGAGSTITQDVPDGGLGIARARQKNISGYFKRLKRRQKRAE